ncbi:hypothetical protein M2272_002340 [Mycobacterium frederiksbergense]|uniref:ESX-1 secretion-associated protein EspA/EspE-like domain-containing protein n=1 Tax=Mycolicibacterium frederiksbergense TaxID=117567 RepID=A0ABT6L088_9MYCO|nr:EspA/EspE family type VII secretion system effector [Mycolicibacterium frederiksbergense]MDH6195700.1 hypothetical protein [Mycolicibacterium frederiksbergense]
MGLLNDIADFGKGVIENNLKWTERAAKVGEFIVRNSVGAQLEQVAKLGGQIVDLTKKAADFFDSQIGKRLVNAARSPILAAGQHAIELMKLSTGVGDPENGQRFGAGADKMGTAGQVLASAFPDDSWDSSGASAYTGRNTEQVGRVQTMRGLDTMVADALSTEAGQIAATRDSLDGQSDWLGAMSLLTMTAGIFPGFGQAARVTSEIAMVAKAVGESTGHLNSLQSNIDQNAAVLRTAAAQYQALANGVTPAGADFAPPVGDPEVPGAPADPGAQAPGGPAGGAPSSGAGAGAPSGGGAPASSAPSLPSNLPGASAPATAPPSADPAGSAAGALGGILGSLISPLSGMLGGVMQAAGQAAQAATQAATQAAQVAGQATGPGAGAAQLDKASGDGTADGADADEKDKAEKDEAEQDKDGKDGKAEGTADGLDGSDQADGIPTGDATRADADPRGDSPGAEAAKTLPPDLGTAAFGGGAAGAAPVHVGADFDQSQLRMAAAATLDRGVPGSAAVIDR